MANLVKNGSGLYSIRFRVGTQRFNRSLETTVEKEAKQEKAKIEKTLRLIEEGEKELPNNPTPEQIWVFLRSGGRRISKTKLAKAVALEQVTKDYFASLPEGAKADRTIKTEHTHAKNLMRHLGESTPLYDLTVARVQNYVSKRQKDEGHRGKAIRADTIKKELQTFRQFWHFALKRGDVSGDCPADDVTLPKHDDKPRFKTWEEIESDLKRGGHSEVEEKELWDCLFLRDDEIQKLLEHVCKTAAHSFIYPMFAFAAFTGARRSEIIRSELGDFRLDEGSLFIREKKRKTSSGTSYRDVSLHSKFKEVMEGWLGKHPGGRYTICTPPGMLRSKVQSDQPEPLSENQAHDHFKRTLAKSKWKVVRGFHVLRHSFASNLARNGIHQSIIDRWMGHQTESMRDRYRHLFPEEKKQAMDAMNKSAYSVGSPSS